MLSAPLSSAAPDKKRPSDRTASAEPDPRDEILSENLWSTEPTSRVECAQPTDTVLEIAYVMANPVEACLVRDGRSWPGLRCAWPCRPMTFKRPSWFFRGEDEGGCWPEEATLELTRPPGYEDMSDEQLTDLIGAAIYEREEQFRTQYDREGRRFLGRRAVLRQSRYARPRKPETRNGISPTLACKDKWRRIERLRECKVWRDEYYRALGRWCAGDRTVVFPAGTYRMRVVHGVQCAPPPD